MLVSPTYMVGYMYNLLGMQDNKKGTAEIIRNSISLYSFYDDSTSSTPPYCAADHLAIEWSQRDLMRLIKPPATSQGFTYLTMLLGSANTSVPVPYHGRAMDMNRFRDHNIYIIANRWIHTAILSACRQLPVRLSLL